FMTKKPSIPRRNKVNWHYVRDDILFSTIKVVSRHQNTQQYGAILPIELTTKDIRNTKAYKEYYACAIGEAAPKPKVSARKKKGGFASSTTLPTPIATPTPTTAVVAAPRLSAAAKGKQPARATSPTDPSDVERTEAEQLKIILRRSRHETHISQHGDFSTDEGTGSKPGVLDVPSDDSDEEISWNSSDDEDVDAQGKDRDDDEVKKNDESDDGQDDDDDDDNDDEEKIAKIDEPKDTESGGDDEETKRNKSIQLSDEQRNLYKALVEAYEADKTILDYYGESAMLKRRRKDADDQERPSAGSDRGSKRRREGGEHVSASTPSEPATRSAGRLPVRWRNPHIRCLKQVQKVNPLFKLLSILNGFPSQGNHQHRIVIGTNLC
nr:hypothetical protein [Tanacetum cinerariifolium]